ncbi:hypothetical protein [Caldiplasma sukawensis]
MGIDEIKEEIISRKLLFFSETLHGENTVYRSFLTMLARKNIFLEKMSKKNPGISPESILSLTKRFVGDLPAEEIEKFLQENFERTFNYILDNA